MSGGVLGGTDRIVLEGGLLASVFLGRCVGLPLARSSSSKTPTSRSYAVGRRLTPALSCRYATTDAADACSTNLFDPVGAMWDDGLLAFVGSGGKMTEDAQAAGERLRALLGEVEVDGGTEVRRRDSLCAALERHSSSSSTAIGSSPYSDSLASAARQDLLVLRQALRLLAECVPLSLPPSLFSLRGLALILLSVYRLHRRPLLGLGPLGLPLLPALDLVHTLTARRPPLALVRRRHRRARHPARALRPRPGAQRRAAPGQGVVGDRAGQGQGARARRGA